MSKHEPSEVTQWHVLVSDSASGDSNTTAYFVQASTAAIAAAIGCDRHTAAEHITAADIDSVDASRWTS